MIKNEINLLWATWVELNRKKTTSKLSSSRWSIIAWWVKLKINDIVTWVAVFITDTLCGCHNCTEETRKPQQLSSFWHPHTSSNCAFVKFLLCAHLISENISTIKMSFAFCASLSSELLNSHNFFSSRLALDFYLSFECESFFCISRSWMDKRDSFIVTFIYVRLNYEKYILKSVLENCNLSSIKLTKITYKKTSIHQTQFKFFFFISIVICLCHCESSKNFPTCKK